VVSVSAPVESAPSVLEAQAHPPLEAASNPSTLTPDAARRLWTQVEKTLFQMKKRSVATFLGGSAAHPDLKAEGPALLIELPYNATFAKQNLERPENRELLNSVVVQLHGAQLPLTFTLGLRGGEAALDSASASSYPAASREGFAAEVSYGANVPSSDTDGPDHLEGLSLFEAASPEAPSAPDASPAPEVPAPEAPSVPDVSPAPETPSVPDVSPAPEAPAPETPSVPENPPSPETPTPESPVPEAPSVSDALSFADIVSASFATTVTICEVDESDGTDAQY
jgi:hypothetical protein